ncbi:unnamed protein product [Urochloa humidicola]
MGVNELGEEAVVEWNGGDDEEDLGQEDNLEYEQERSPKRRRDNSTKDGIGDKMSGGISEKDPTYFGTLKEQIQNMSEEEFNLFLKQKVEEILDLSVGKVLGQVVDKVMEEKEHEQGSEKEDSVTGGQGIGGDFAPANISLLEAKASIPDMVISPTRSSPRLMRSKEEHSLAKAEILTAKKNLEHPGDRFVFWGE